MATPRRAAKAVEEVVEPQETFREEVQEVVEEVKEEFLSLEKRALELKDKAMERVKAPFVGSNLSAARATFDTSGNAGVADHDSRRASAAFDVEALANEDLPDHLAKYVVSDQGAPAILRREEELRADAPSSKKNGE